MKLVKLLGLKRNLPSGFFMFKEERTSPNRVALKSTIPSLVRGIFIVTRRCKKKAKITSLPSQMSWHNSTTSFRLVTPPGLIPILSRPLFPSTQYAYLAGFSMRAEFSKPQRWRDSFQQRNYINMFDVTARLWVILGPDPHVLI